MGIAYVVISNSAKRIPSFCVVLEVVIASMAAAKDFKVVSPRLFEFEVPESEFKGEGLKPHIPVKQTKAKTRPATESKPVSSTVSEQPVEELEPGFPNDPGADIVLNEAPIKVPTAVLRPLSAASRRSSKATETLRTKAVAAISKYEQQTKIWEKSTAAAQARKALVKKKPQVSESDTDVVSLIAQYHEGKKLSPASMAFLKEESRKQAEEIKKQAEEAKKPINVDLLYGAEAHPHPWMNSESQSQADAIPSLDSSFEELP